MTENKNEQDQDELERLAFLKVSQVIDQRLPELKMRGKTYLMTESAVQAANALINSTRGGELRDVITAAAMAVIAGTHPELMEKDGMDNLTRAQQKKLTTEGIETIFAVALDTLRGGMDAVEELDATCSKMVKAQSKRIDALVDTPEWETIKSSPNFRTGTIKEVMRRIEDKDEPEDKFDGMYL